MCSCRQALWLFGVHARRLAYLTAAAAAATIRVTSTLCCYSTRSCMQAVWLLERLAQLTAAAAAISSVTNTLCRCSIIGSDHTN